MGQGKLGRYCEQAKRWLIPEVWAKWWRKKKRTAKQLKASRDESYGKFGSKMKKKGKINR